MPRARRSPCRRATIPAETPKVLLVEDEPAIAYLERDALERAGLRVEEVDRGARALERLTGSDRVALVVLDYFLPDMNGDEILAALGERIASLPVVVVTGSSDPSIEKRMRAAGVCDYIVKDVDLRFLESLPRVVHAAIERYPPPAA